MSEVLIKSDWKSTLHNSLRGLVLVVIVAWIANLFGHWVNQVFAGVAVVVVAISGAFAGGQLFGHIRQKTVADAVQRGVSRSEAETRFDERYVD